MLNANDFNIPPQHPYGMLDGYTNAYEKEHALASMLVYAIEANDLYAALEHTGWSDEMVQDGLLERCGEDQKYILTNKALGLLYSVYHHKY